MNKVHQTILSVSALLTLGVVMWASPLNHLQNLAIADTSVRANDSRATVVGNLGGMPVSIPKHFAEYVEYADDPGWGERQLMPHRKRTHSSSLRSFGFDVRYPGMLGKETPALVDDKHRQKMNSTMWLRVGVSTGPIYPKHGFLDRVASYINESGRKYPYTQLAKPLHGLVVYTPKGIDPSTRRPFHTHHEDKDLFIDRDRTGRVTTYIECSNVDIPSAPCTQTFSLEPEVSAEIRVSYRRGLLPEWHTIQNQVTQLIQSWRAPVSGIVSVNR